MKRGLIFIAIFLLIGSLGVICADPMPVIPGELDNVILRLSSETNAHAELGNLTNYNTLINYEDIFGDSGEVYSNECTGNNVVLRLSSETNAHAEGPLGTNYNAKLCFGNLQCSLVEGDCSAEKECVVKLSSETNAHLEICSESNYAYSLCCSRGIIPCEDYTTKAECFESPLECTWTPPTAENTSQGGGCCPNGERWDSNENLCKKTSVAICNSVWAIDNQVFGESYRLSGNTYQYCAQVTKGLSYGFWYDINKF